MSTFPIHILIVDDRMEWVRSIQHCCALTHPQLQFHHVLNGAEGVEAIRREPLLYEAVIMDIEMPCLDGIAATAQLRQLNYTRPIVICSSGGEEKREAGIRAGANCAVDKMDAYRILPEMLQRLGVMER